MVLPHFHHSSGLFRTLIDVYQSSWSRSVKIEYDAADPVSNVRQQQNRFRNGEAGQSVNVTSFATKDFSHNLYTTTGQFRLMLSHFKQRNAIKAEDVYVQFFFPCLLDSWSCEAFVWSDQYLARKSGHRNAIFRLLLFPVNLNNKHGVLLSFRSLRSAPWTRTIFHARTDSSRFFFSYFFSSSRIFLLLLTLSSGFWSSEIQSTRATNNWPIGGRTSPEDPSSTEQPIAKGESFGSRRST